MDRHLLAMQRTSHSEQHPRLQQQVNLPLESSGSFHQCTGYLTTLVFASLRAHPVFAPPGSFGLTTSEPKTPLQNTVGNTDPRGVFDVTARRGFGRCFIRLC